MSNKPPAIIKVKGSSNKSHAIAAVVGGVAWVVSEQNGKRSWGGDPKMFRSGILIALSLFAQDKFVEFRQVRHDMFLPSAPVPINNFGNVTPRSQRMEFAMSARAGTPQAGPEFGSQRRQQFGSQVPQSQVRGFSGSRTSRSAP